MSAKLLKKGDKVVMHTCKEAEKYDGKIWTCKTDETKLHPSHNSTVVWLEGYNGAFSTKYLQKVNINQSDARNIGFIQGVAFSAALAHQFHIDGKGIINESNISIEHFIKYADEYDLEILGLIKKD